MVFAEPLTHKIPAGIGLGQAASAPAHPRPAGILVNGIDSVLNPVASGVTCTNTNLITDELKEGRKPSDLLN